MSRAVHRVRTTRRPDLVIEVDDATYTDLARRGQLLPAEPEPEPDEDVAPVVEAAEPDPEPRPRRRRAE